MRLSLTGLATVMLLSPVASRQLTAVRVAENQDLQAAINAARPGDTILLQRGAHFRGNFVLPAHPDAAAFITIRTDSPALPADGTRVTPSASGALAVIESPNSDPALRTAPAAHHWRIENVEFGPNRHGDGNIIELGRADAEQHDPAQVPHDLVLDRVYIHGDPATGQKRAVALNSASTTIVNSYITDIKGVGVDTQAIAGWNGPGPYTIENNQLEAAGENVMFGGGDPSIENLVPTDITIRHNTIRKPLAWREPVVKAPAGVQAAPAGDGTLPSGAYAYTVVAELALGSGSTADSLAGGNATVNAGGAVRVSWQPVDGASGYRVYRSGPGGDMFWRVADTSFTDTGMPGTAGAPPKKASTWTVKNLLELKNASQVTIDGNVFENHWAGAQTGYAILFTPRNQEGKAPWARVDHVRFTNNIVRHVAAGININGTDNEHPSGRTSDIVVQNNVFEDVNGKTWGGPGDFLQLGDGPADVRIEGNAIDETGRIASVYGSSRGREVTGFVFRDNVVRHNAYGIIGRDVSPGSATFERYLPNAVFEGNVIAGGGGTRYPGSNRFVSDGEFEKAYRDHRASLEGETPKK